MSSKVAAGAALPWFSWTFGPVGTAASAGAGPRPGGTIVQTIVALSDNQSQGSPLAVFRRSSPLIKRALPVAASATQSSIPLALVFRNDRCFPSGEKRTCETLGCGGILTRTSLESLIRFSV